jgi:hypothetical protein
MKAKCPKSVDISRLHGHFTGAHYYIYLLSFDNLFLRTPGESCIGLRVPGLFSRETPFDQLRPSSVAKRLKQKKEDRGLERSSSELLDSMTLCSPLIVAAALFFRVFASSRLRTGSLRTSRLPDQPKILCAYSGTVGYTYVYFTGESDRHKVKVHTFCRTDFDYHRFATFCGIVFLFVQDTLLYRLFTAPSSIRGGLALCNCTL